MISHLASLGVGDQIVDDQGRATINLVQLWQYIVSPVVTTVTQATSRTTGVTLEGAAGKVQLVSAAGTTSWQTFTVTNGLVSVNDMILVEQVSGTDLYLIHVTAVAAGSFDITFATTGGTTTEQPVFAFRVLSGRTT